MDRDTVWALRRSNRLQLILPARCRSRSGFVDQVVISDLSEHGCRIDSLGLILRVGDMVVVRPAGIEGQTGVIRWIRGHSAGIEFDRPLYAPVVEHLHRSHERFVKTEYPARFTGKLHRAA